MDTVKQEGATVGYQSARSSLWSKEIIVRLFVDQKSRLVSEERSDGIIPKDCDETSTEKEIAWIVSGPNDYFTEEHCHPHRRRKLYRGGE